jgi:excinuclease ABC subunit C
MAALAHSRSLPFVDLSRVPREPGCYFWKGTHQGKHRTLYIGKAKDLRNRINQYVQAAEHGVGDAKTLAMLARATALEWVATRDEVEALVLEARLIRTEKPPFNIDLKENRRYAYIKITKDEFPRLVTVRSHERGADVVGPFVDGTARFEMMRLARRIFRLRVCSKMPKKVCLYYHLGQCSGPCEGKIAKEDYLVDVGRARRFLRGEAHDLRAELERDMAQASERLQFEEAKRLRDALRAMHSALRRDTVVRERTYDEDAIAMRKTEQAFVFLILHVRKGVVTGTEEVRLREEDLLESDPWEAFMIAYYAEHQRPAEILVETPPAPDLVEYFRRDNTALVCPRAGAKSGVVQLAVRNLLARIDATTITLQALQDALRLPFPPKTIDAFDNSQLMGTNMVSACVQFTNGGPHKAGYQKFLIRTTTNDDFAAMREVMRRRYAKRPLPDLVLIDGGKGQLMAAYHALAELGHRVPIIGLAKREEEVFVPGLAEPLPIDAKSEASLYLQRIRNEIHRFVISFHRARRTRAQVASELDGIAGVGEVTRFKLLKRFGSVDGVRVASDEELRRVVSEQVLCRLRDRLR